NSESLRIVWRLIRQLLPTLLKTLRIRQVLCQQIISAARQVTTIQQSRGAYLRLLQRLNSHAFTLPVPLGAGGDEQLGQYLFPIPFTVPHETLPRQDTQPAMDLQRLAAGKRQRDIGWGCTPGVAESGRGRTHLRLLLFLAVRRVTRRAQ